MILKSKQRIYLIDQGNNTFDLVFDLIRCHEDMSIILREAANPHQSMKLTRFLMTMNQSQLTYTKRQVTVRTWFRCIYNCLLYTSQHVLHLCISISCC